MGDGLSIEASEEGLEMALGTTGSEEKEDEVLSGTKGGVRVMTCLGLCIELAT